MTETAQSADDIYRSAMKGSFTSTLRWHHLDALWEQLQATADDSWYIYAVGETPPAAPSSREQLLTFIDEMDDLLRREHDEEYCGIVYADDLEQPGCIKVYDPNNLGVSCGYSDNPPLPGWILSRIPPCDLALQQILPGNRRRWWRRLLCG
ncbi:MAG: hypothetical protein GY696_23405 [Gammaproteobacteria bacterium]|nr:hypothetical protein [Gammaproteobacteria bacterium]